MAQIEVKKEEQKFQPVTLTITFKTKEELCVFAEMCSQNITVPETVRSLTRDQKNTLGSILGEIYQKL